MPEVFIDAPDGVRGLADAGLARALSGDWTSGTAAERVRDFWGYTIAHVFVESRLVGKFGGSADEGAVYVLDAGLPAPPPGGSSRYAAAGHLRQTLIDLARINARTGSRFVGSSELIPGRLKLSTETGWLPVAAAVLVKVGAAAAVAYCFAKAVEVVDNYLARDANVRAIVQTDAHALDLIKQHQQREDSVGQPIPLGAGTKLELDRLAKRRSDLVEKMPKLPGPAKKAGLGLSPLQILALGAGVAGGLWVWRRT